MLRRAFTLVEVLLVILLIGAIVFFAYPDFQAEFGRRSLTESADRLRALIVMCHSEAMREGRYYRIEMPNTPDPNDPDARKTVEVPLETEQPRVIRQQDLLNPESWEDFDAYWKSDNVLQNGTRCIGVFPGRPNFDIQGTSPIAGPQIDGTETTFVPVIFNPDGTCDWATFVLTDLPPDTELQPSHVARILNVIVDGRTGQVWIQRALRVEEVEVMQERGASPIFHMDFLSPQPITEENILEIHVRQGGAVGSGGGR
jgi:prepilin-type N-terminal cleavage/methylation domain-containing protein